MKKTWIVTCIAALALVMVLPMQLQAQQGGHIRFGNLSLIPGVEVQGIYDDNIYKGNGQTYTSAVTTKDEKKESDWITHAKPSFFLNYLMPERGSINLGYQGDFAFYGTNDKNNWKNNQGLLDVNYFAPGGLILGINDIFSNSEDPLGNANQYALGRVTKRWTNDLKTKLGYHIASNFRMIAYYNNSRQQYQDKVDYSQDFNENEYGAGMEVRFLPKTWGFVRYHYGTREYTTLAAGQLQDYLSDYKYHRASAGLTWDSDAKLSGEVNFGYQWLKYDHLYTSAAKTSQREDKNTWTAATAVNFLPTATTTLSLNINRAVRNSGSDTNEQFTDTGIGFSLRQQLLAKLTLLAGVNYSKNEYNTLVAAAPTKGLRTDDNYMANIGLNYAIQEWLGVGVGYNYSRKNSNDEFQEYVDNQFMAFVKVVY